MRLDLIVAALKAANGLLDQERECLFDSSTVDGKLESMDADSRAVYEEVVSALAKVNDALTQVNAAKSVGFICAAWKKLSDGCVARCDKKHGHDGDHLDSVILVGWKRPASIAADSPALCSQSGLYPASWHGRVPKRVVMAKRVQSDFPFNGRVADVGREFCCWVNSHGAVAVIFENGEKLGVKPYEFEVIDWWPIAEVSQ